MKEQKWDDFDTGKEFLEAVALPLEDSEETPSASGNNKSRATELRRRIEERLDSKRIALEYDYLMLDEFDLGDELPDSSENWQ